MYRELGEDSLFEEALNLQIKWWAGEYTGRGREEGSSGQWWVPGVGREGV